MCVRALVKKEIVPASGESIRDCGFIFFRRNRSSFPLLPPQTLFFGAKRLARLRHNSP
jgi:hypothetical protein